MGERQVNDLSVGIDVKDPPLRRFFLEQCILQAPVGVIIEKILPLLEELDCDPVLASLGNDLPVNTLHNGYVVFPGKDRYGSGVIREIVPLFHLDGVQTRNVSARVIIGFPFLQVRLQARTVEDIAPGQETDIKFVFSRIGVRRLEKCLLKFRWSSHVERCLTLRDGVCQDHIEYRERYKKGGSKANCKHGYSHHHSTPQHIRRHLKEGGSMVDRSVSSL